MPKWLTLVAAGITVFLGCTYKDRTPPTVQIIQPAKNATIVAGQTPIKVFADDRELARVELYVDTTVLDTFEAGDFDTFNYTWDATSKVPGSSHVIVARAADRWGNTAEDSCPVMFAGGTGPTHHAADIVVNEVWWPSGNPHVVTAGINVSQGATLTILPGCAVQFDSGAGLTVGLGSAGEIQAVGTSDSAILFVSSLASPGRGVWYGLRFYEGTRWSSRLSYCQVENGGELGGAAVSLLWGAIVKMDHTTIKGSAGYGIDFSQRGHCTDFEYNTITGCTGNPMRIYPDAIRFLGPNNNLAGNGTDEIVVDSGTVAASGTWRNHGMPYIVAGGVQVGGAALPVLTIEPGTALKFRAGVGIKCGQGGPGGIVAAGAPGSVVAFTSDSPAPARGDWVGLRFYGGTFSSTRLSQCVIEYAGASASPAVLDSGGPGIQMDHCVIRHSGGAGVNCVAGGYVVSFSDNTVTDCADYPVGLAPDYVRYLGSGNTLTGNDPGKDAVLVSGGDVASSGTWRNLGVPYIIKGAVGVLGDSGPVVTIEAGTTVEFQTGAGVTVADTARPGGFVADGTGGQITFTSAADAPQPGDWKSIYFKGGALDQQCRLRNCLIEYGGGDGKGNVVIRDARPEVSGCSIGFSQAWGIYLDGAEYPDPDGLEADNTFYSNDSGNVRRP
jgi:hypothetical protein